MSKQKTAAIILAAGLGTRMKSTQSKVMHPLGGRPMINHLLATLGKMEIDKTVVVVGPDMADLEAAVAPHKTAVQHERLGTGDALKTGMAALESCDGDILVLYGDTPLLSQQTLNAMLEARRTGKGPLCPSVVVLGFAPQDPGTYGRLVMDEDDGELMAIIEAADASQEELANELCNSGVMCFDGALLPQFLPRLKNDNAKEEYYLTDCVALAREDGFGCTVVFGEEEELIGVNSRSDLAQVETLFQDACRDRAMKGGATLLDPSTVYFSFDTKIGRDVVIEPNVHFGPGVNIADNVTIKSFCHIEGASIATGATVGPFARLRPGTRLAEDTKVGNFVEIKNTDIKAGAKISHLSYVGDAKVGQGANIGAGTITCNYDGFAKHKTDIGAGAFIGSNTALVAPLSIGEGAIIGAGSTVTRDVAQDAIVTARGEQKALENAAPRYRAKKDIAKQ